MKENNVFEAIELTGMPQKEKTMLDCVLEELTSNMFAVDGVEYKKRPKVLTEKDKISTKDLYRQLINNVTEENVEEFANKVIKNKKRNNHIDINVKRIQIVEELILKYLEVGSITTLKTLRCFVYKNSEQIFIEAKEKHGITEGAVIKALENLVKNGVLVEVPFKTKTETYVELTKGYKRVI